MRPRLVYRGGMSHQMPLAEEALGDGGEVWHGDAYDLVSQLPSDSTDLILTSPPYWGLRTYGHVHDEQVLDRWTADGMSTDRVPPYDWYRQNGGVLGLEPYPVWYVTHLVEWFSKARRVLRESGSIWVNLGDTYFARWASIRDEGRQGYSGERSRRRTPSGGYLHDKQMLMIPARFAIAMQDEGWILRNDVIWSKGAGLPRPETDRLRLSHEHWFHFVQRSSGGRPRYFYDLDAAETDRTDVISSPPTRGDGQHSATFPSAIVRPRILSSSPSGGLVLDPFSGSGTTVAEAVACGRRSIGFELSEKFAETSRLSIQNGTRLTQVDPVVHE